MNFIPYLTFSGNCREAFARYAEVFGVPVPQAMTYGEAPEEDRAQMGDVPPEHVMHTQIEVAGGVLMGADGPRPDGIGGVVINAMVDDVAEAHRIFAALLDGGTVQMPIAETFWSPAFGMGVDRFGTPWMVYCRPAS